MLKQILQKYPEIYKGKDFIKDIESCSSGIIRKILIGLIENNKGSKRWREIILFLWKFYGEFANGISVYIEIFSKTMGFTILQGIDNEYSEIIKRDYHNLFL